MERMNESPFRGWKDAHRNYRSIVLAKESCVNYRIEVFDLVHAEVTFFLPVSGRRLPGPFSSCFPVGRNSARRGTRSAASEADGPFPSCFPVGPNLGQRAAHSFSTV